VKLSGKRKILGAAAGLAVIAAAVYFLFWRAPAVPVIVVKTGEIEGRVHGPGTVQSKVPVAVSPKITGIVEKLFADQGDRVTKGQLLAELDSAELRAKETASRAAVNRAQRELARALADLGKAQANLNLARSNYQRDLEVFKPGYISKAAFDTTKAQLKVAESEVNAFQAAVTALQAAVKQAESEARAAQALHHYTRIVAPMDGLITSRKAEVGATLGPGSPIFQMVDLETIWVAALIDQGQIAQIKVGQKADIRLRSGRQYQGQVVRLNAEADTVTRELEVNVKFARTPDPLAIGEEAEVDIDTGKVHALAVPLTAVLERECKNGVLVVEKSRLEFRFIKTGPNDGKRLAVIEGLREGDLVVIQPTNLKPGMQVRPQTKSQEAQGK
jgi:RND family efflux transporter MFP subunit